MQIQRRIAKRIKVKGIVQGVGYRYFVYEKANQIGISGYVKNLADGSVEIVCQCDEDKMNKLLEHLKLGPVYSKVENIDIEEIDCNQLFDGFEIKF